MADCNKVDDGLKKEIEAGKTLKDTPVPETGVNTHDATLAGEKQCPVSKYSVSSVHVFLIQYPSIYYPVSKYPAYNICYLVLNQVFKYKLSKYPLSTNHWVLPDGYYPISIQVHI